MFYPICIFAMIFVDLYLFSPKQSITHHSTTYTNGREIVENFEKVWYEYPPISFLLWLFLVRSVCYYDHIYNGLSWIGFIAWPVMLIPYIPWVGFIDF